MYNKGKLKKISLICDLYTKNKTTINENKYIELINSNKEYLNQKVYAIIDRPIESKPIKEHPEFKYELNYGYIPNTLSGDGEELDCYILGVKDPIQDFTGKCIAIIHRINEDDDKLILVPNDKDYSIKEIEELTYIKKKHHKSFVYKE